VTEREFGDAYRALVVRPSQVRLPNRWQRRGRRRHRPGSVSPDAARQVYVVMTRSSGGVICIASQPI
jgi:hypothetical protein